MIKYSILTIAIAFCWIENLNASSQHYDDDLVLSKRELFLSGVPFSEVAQNDGTKGVLTLCFKQQFQDEARLKPTYDHAALAFEMFLPNSAEPNNISMMLIHYGQEDDCSGLGGKHKIMIDNHTDTLKKVYRAVRISPIDGSSTLLPPLYTRYASWILPNKHLLKGLEKAIHDQEAGSSQGNCVKYVARIMRSIGLTDLDFGFWTTKPENLRLLVNEHVSPKPSLRNNKLPKYGW